VAYIGSPMRFRCVCNQSQ